MVCLEGSARARARARVCRSATLAVHGSARSTCTASHRRLACGSPLLTSRRRSRAPPPTTSGPTCAFAARRLRIDAAALGRGQLPPRRCAAGRSRRPRRGRATARPISRRRSLRRRRTRTTRSARSTAAALPTQTARPARPTAAASSPTRRASCSCTSATSMWTRPPRAAPRTTLPFGCAQPLADHPLCICDLRVQEGA